MKFLSKYGIFDLNKRLSIDLRPLENLTNLKELNLFGTPIYSLEPIKGLINLKYLYIGGCENISDKQTEDLKKVSPELYISKL